MKLRLIFITFLTWAGAHLAHGDGEVTKLTLPQCIDIGIRNSTPVLKGENDVALSGEVLLQSYAQFLPNLTANASYGYVSGTTLYNFTGSNLVTEKAWVPSYALSTTLNLFNGLADFGALKSALALRQVSLSSLFWAKQQVILDLVQSYLQVVLDKLLLDIAVKNLEASNERLKLLQKATQVGSTALSDLYRQQAQTSSDELLLISSQARVVDDEILLIRKLRVDPKKKYEFEMPPLNPAPATLGEKPLDELTEMSLASRSDVRAREFQVQRTNWDITRARSGYFPSLNLTFSRSAAGAHLNELYYNGTNSLPAFQQSLWSQLGNQVTYNVSLGLTWNIFDRFVTREAVATTRTAWENAQIDHTDSELQSTADVRTAYNDYQVAVRQLRTARVGVKAAREAFDAITGRYGVGGASFLDVLTSQTTLVQSESSEAQATVNLKLREKTLDFAVGVLMP